MGASGSARRVKMFQLKKSVQGKKCNKRIVVVVRHNFIIFLYKKGALKDFHEISGLTGTS